MRYYLFVFTVLLFLDACKKDDEDVTKNALSCDYFREARILTNDPAKEVDYEINCVMEITDEIVIEEGVVIHFGPDAGILIKESGSLKIQGTADMPVKLTGANKLKGFWKGILIQSSSLNNSFSNVIIEFAGGQPFNSNNDKASVILWSDSFLKMDNCKIENSGSYGLSAVYNNTMLELNDNVYNSCNEAPIKIIPSYMNRMDWRSSHAGNVKDIIEVEINTDDIRNSVEWHALDVPYRVISNYSGFDFLLIRQGLVTIKTGVLIEFSSGTGLYIDDNGGLNVDNPSDAVYFTGVVKQPGSWKGLYFQFSQANNVLDNVYIEYAGNLYDGAKHGIGMWGNPRLSIGSSKFSNIDGCAIIDFNNSEAAPNPNFNFFNNAIIYENISNGAICYQ
ncbi:MAG: hypothetical protein ACK4GL_11185 [Flavobacteriales bacterium]